MDESTKFYLVVTIQTGVLMGQTTLAKTYKLQKEKKDMSANRCYSLALNFNLCKQTLAQLLKTCKTI